MSKALNHSDKLNKAFSQTPHKFMLTVPVFSSKLNTNSDNKRINAIKNHITLY